MAAFSISSYTVVGKQKKMEDGRKVNLVKVVVGDGVSTYPAGGLAINKGNLGCPVNVDMIDIIDQGGQGLQWFYDSVNLKFRAFVTGAHAHSLVLKNAAVADGVTTRVNAGTNLLGANTGADITVAGAGANGGVQNTADIPLTEASTAYVLPTHTLLVQVIGY